MFTLNVIQRSARGILMGLLFIVLAILPSVSAYAQTAPELRAILHPWYDPEFAICSEDATSNYSFSSGTNIENAFKFFVSQGFTPEQAAGIVGNFRRESGEKDLNPEALNSIGAYGIAQWLGGRLQNLISFANGKQSSLEVQLKFVMHELQGAEKSAYEKMQDVKTPEGANSAQQLETVNKAAAVWAKFYERPEATESTEGSTGLKKRQELSRQVYHSFANEVVGEVTQTDSDQETTSSRCQDEEDSGGSSAPVGSYFRNTDDMQCKIGIDQGVQTGYHDNKPYQIRICSVKGIWVNVLIEKNINDLVTANSKFSGGGFRTMASQIELRRQHCGTSQYDIYKKPSGQCSPRTARPGYSNHQMGLAIDFRYDGGSIGSHSNAGYIWLNQNASQYGLKNLPDEPWHWSVNGK